MRSTPGALFALLSVVGCGRLRLVNTDGKTGSQTRGRLIVFEGIDGTGKSTHARLLAEYLAQKGIRACTSFEPTRGEWGMRVRSAAVAGQRLSVEEEIHCLLQDRREHVETLIKPALAAGQWVLLDRYYLSMMAYQGATGADAEQIRRWNEEFAPQPDLAFWLEIPVEVSMQRIRERGMGSDAFEKSSFQEACSRIYASMRFPWLHRIDASGDMAATQQMVRDMVDAVLLSDGASHR